MLGTIARPAAACLLALGAIGMLAPQTVKAGTVANHLPGTPKAKSEAPPGPAMFVGKVGTPGPEGDRYTFAVRGQPWSKVLAWYADASGRALVCEPVTGTFTFIPPREKRTYTLDEIGDILDDGLLIQKNCVLIRRTRTLTVVPADDPALHKWIPMVRPEELGKRSKSEVVKVAVLLAVVPSEHLVPHVKKLMTPCGQAIPVGGTNQLILIDTVGTLRRVVPKIKEIEAGLAKEWRGREDQ
jgi:hypothetical protein